jgi:hypothetical protein
MSHNVATILMVCFLCILLFPLPSYFLSSAALGKANQDSYLICESFLDPSCHFFGVFDGHGEFGDYCSHFAADHVRLPPPIPTPPPHPVTYFPPQ